MGRSVVSTQDAHSNRGSFTGTSQLHSARSRLAHNWYSLAGTKPACPLVSSSEITSSAICSIENPSALPQFRQVEFSKVRRWPHLGQVKSRIGHHVDGHVDHAVL